MNLLAVLLSTVLMLLAATHGNAQNIILDLDTDNASTNTAVTFIEAERRIGLLENSNIGIQDDQGGSTTLSRATVQFFNPTAFDLNFERLELNVTRLLPTIQSAPVHTFANGLLTIDGTYSFMEYEVILQAVDYINTNQNPNDDTMRIIQFQVFDGSSESNTARVSFNMFRIFNDPPLLYLGGTSEEQQNKTITFSTANNDGQGDVCVPIISGSFDLSDPDSSGITSLCFEVETNTESVSSRTGVIQPISENMYCAYSSTFGSTQLSSFQQILQQAEYCISTEPTSPETRIVRAFVEDNGIVSPGGSTAGGLLAKSEIAFLFVMFPGSGIAAQPSTSEIAIPMSTTVITTLSTTLTPSLTTLLSPSTTLSPSAEFQSTTRFPTRLSSTIPTISATCPREEHVPLFSGAMFTLFLYNWTETNIGQIQMRPCPQICQQLANVPSQGSVIRICNSITAQWTDVDFSSCGLTKSALQLCEANQLLRSAEAQDIDAEGISESVANITTNSSQLGTSGVSSATALLEGLTNAAIEQPEVRENYLQAIDNILDTDPDVILSSQIETNSSARLLQSLTQFTQNVPLSSLDNDANSTINETNRLVFALRNFGLVFQDVPVDDFSGSDFSVDLGPVKDAIRLNGSIDENSLLSVAIPNATASLRVPASVFDANDDVVSRTNSVESSALTPSHSSIKTRRLVFSVFLVNSLFIDNNTSCDLFAIGSIIVSVDFNVTTNHDNPFNRSIQVSLQEYREACDDNTPDSTMPMCARFAVTDDNVKWTSEDCTLISSEGGTTRCDCSQPGHFGLIFDVKPGPAIQPLILMYVTYIGAILSIICLMVMFCTHLFSSDLRSAKHSFSGHLIMNICITLIGFYLTFLIAGHVTTIQPLCGVVAALIQYFLLAYFVWTAVAAVVLYLSIVYWFKKQGPTFVLKAAIIAWFLPLVIVAISAGAGYRNYVNDYFCRSTGKPFYFGTLLPFGLLYLFNWIIFALIIVVRIRDHIEKNKTRDHNNSSSDEKLKDAKKTIFLALGLSFLFGLGWGFGLAATTRLNIPKLTFVFQLLFSIFVGAQGILILLLHGLRSPRVRKQWKVWCMKVCFCKRLKLRPKSPTGVAEYGFQANSLRRDDNQANETPLNGTSNLPNGVSSQNMQPDDSLSSHGSPPKFYRKHAQTVSTIKSHVALCRVDTQLTTLDSDLSTSGGDSDGSDPEKFLETV